MCTFCFSPTLIRLWPCLAWQPLHKPGSRRLQIRILSWGPLLLWPVSRSSLAQSCLCLQLNKWVRTVAANALPTLPCRRLWQQGWVVEIALSKLNIKDALPQALLPRQTTPANILTILRGLISYKWRRDCSFHCSSPPLTFTNFKIVIVWTAWQSRTVTGQPWWGRAVAPPCLQT